MYYSVGKERFMKRVENSYPTFWKSVAVVGGIMTLEPQYKKILKENHFLPNICNQNANGFWGKVEGADFIILFAGTVSHGMAIKARKTAAACGIPLVTVTPSSISALKKSIADLRVRPAFKIHGDPRLRNSPKKREVHADVSQGR
jgi:hypothetical protein